MNLPVEQARALLTDQGFKVTELSVANDTVQAGVVFDQDPKGETSVDEGSVVTISVSQGATPIEVPDVVGQDELDAVAALQGAGFTVDVQQQASDTVFKGQVISQSPAAAATAPKGSKVIIVVSSGKAEAEVPELAGESATSAANRLCQIGFAINQIDEFSNDVPRGRVIRTDPAAGTKVDPKSTTVTIFVSAGPEATTTMRPDHHGADHHHAHHGADHHHDRPRRPPPPRPPRSPDRRRAVRRPLRGDEAPVGVRR